MTPNLFLSAWGIPERSRSLHHGSVLIDLLLYSFMIYRPLRDAPGLGAKKLSCPIQPRNIFDFYNNKTIERMAVQVIPCCRFYVDMRRGQKAMIEKLSQHRPTILSEPSVLFKEKRTFFMSVTACLTWVSHVYCCCTTLRRLPRNP